MKYYITNDGHLCSDHDNLSISQVYMIMIIYDGFVCLHFRIIVPPYMCWIMHMSNIFTWYFIYS